MEDRSKTRTQTILVVMKVLCWLAFAGLMLNAGGTLFSYVLSLFNPEAARGIYPGVDLYTLSQVDFKHYTAGVLLRASVSAMKGYVFFVMIEILTKVNLANPFTMEVAVNLEKMSYLALGAWLVSVIQSAHRSWVIDNTGWHLQEFYSGEFFLMAGLMYIISKVFKRGVELQDEKDLTV